MQPLLTSEPTQVGDYQFLARLGRGSMGGVYLARSKGGRVVAVKLVRLDLADDPEFRERFRREVMMARSVGGFWTAAVVDADPDAEQPWLATEYVPGPTLHRAVADHGPLPEHAVRSLAAGLAEALGAVHRAGLVHRDLKPANVLLGPDGPRIIDFGISRAVQSSTLTATGQFLGTPGYFSPEQTLGTEIGPASDVFSLASVLVFAATGTGPFGNENTAAMLYRAVHAEADLSRVPPGLRPLLASCLAKDALRRPSASEMLNQVDTSVPQGDAWLPSEITAVITEHTMELQKTTEATNVPPSPGPAPVPPVRPHTKVEAPAPPPPAPSRPAPSPPIPVDLERTNEIKPARPKGTNRQPTAPASVRRDQPGPEFNTGGRFAAFLSAAFAAGVFLMATYLVNRYGTLGGPVTVLEIGMSLLAFGGGLSLLKAVCPRLRLKINSDGLRLSRAGMSREIAWDQVKRIGVTGRGKKQALAIWCVEGAPVPKTTLWHPVRSYHGGVRIFPVGTSGGWLKRRRESKRIRTALSQYAQRRYDDRML